MKEKPWQLRLVRKSLKKKEKLRLIQTHLTVRPSFISLDLGCAQGILSYFLRRKGGSWVHTDLDFTNLKSSRPLLQKDLVQIEEGMLPFKSHSFDLVACLDYLEHVADDSQCLTEIYRVLKSGGKLVLATPHTGRFFILQKIRPALGLKLEFYGHKREGYSLKELKKKLRQAGFKLTQHQTYSRLFTELLELILNFLYIKVLSHKPADTLRDGHIRPSTPTEFHSQKKAFALYSLIYPLIWLVSRLDRLLFFQRGYSLMVWAEKKRL
ncbi:MAG: methyltransferase domain-containing protein [Candidatus Aminicenantales bacterium]